MNTYNIPDDPAAFYDEKYIGKVLMLHPAECVFELDAPRKIMQRLSVRPITEWHMAEHGDEFRECWHQSEMYCPHEGIDRLAECGVKSLDWELA